MEEINEMTIRQMRINFYQATKRRAYQQINFITGVAIGAQSDKTGINKAIKQIEQQITDYKI